jgi:hypothetical protein
MYQCVTDGCENEAIFDTNICDSCLQKASEKKSLTVEATRIQVSMTEVVLCGCCVRWILREKFDSHEPCLGLKNE